MKKLIVDTFTFGTDIDRIAVTKFLRAHPELVDVLFEGQSLVERRFGVGHHIRLEIFTDPESEELIQELHAHICTSLPVEEALERLDAFDVGWTLGMSPQVCKNLSFHLELTKDEKESKVDTRITNVNGFRTVRTNAKKEAEIRDIIILAQETYRVRRPNVCAELRAHLNGVSHVGIGFSKVNWPDKWDEDTGKWIAARKAAKQILQSMKEAPWQERVGLKGA